jgi:hypothetical protein
LLPFVAANPAVDFFPLQMTVPSGLPANIHRVTDELMTFADTAALIEQLDLVISVDTSVIHLAGALGKPAWLLLPRRYEWRWSLDGESNNWYHSVCVLRQTRNGDWDYPLQEAFGPRLARFLDKSKLPNAVIGK